MVSKVAFGVQDFVGRREGKGRKIVGPRFKGLGWSDQFWVLGSGRPQQKIQNSKKGRGAAAV